MTTDIKTGDEKLRAFVVEAKATAGALIALAAEHGFGNEEREVRLMEASLPILDTFLTGDAPYVQSQVIGLAEAITGRKL